MTHDRPEQDLSARVDRLEREIEELRRALGAQRTAPERESRGPERPRVEARGGAAAGRAPEAPASDVGAGLGAGGSSASMPLAFDLFKSIDRWLPRIGIGLVILALGLAFKYSIDQGWIVPGVRIALGYALGVSLLVAGFRLANTRPDYVQVLFGGAVATFYVTAFAAFRLYGLFSYPFALMLMTAATVLAFVLSLQYERASLSVIGVAGGLGTPFLLYTGSGNIPGLILYTALVMGGASAIFFVRGWRSLLGVNLVGGWAVLFAALAAASSLFSHKASVQFGAVYAWLSFWALPLVREVVTVDLPAQRRDADSDVEGDTAPATERRRRHVHVLSVTMPLLALGMTALVWELSRAEAGLVALALAVVYWLAARALAARPAMAELVRTQTLVALMLGTLALVLLIEGPALLVVLATEGVVVHVLAQRQADALLTGWAHFLFLIVGVWMIARLFDGARGIALLNRDAITDLWVLATIVWAAGVLARCGMDDARRGYLLAAHGGVLVWLWRELVGLSHGHALVSLAWAAYGGALLVFGLRRSQDELRNTGAVTLLLLVGKLFVVDLANVDAVWRILLFMVVGGGFLLLGYLFPGLRGSPPDEEASRHAGRRAHDGT